MRKVWIKTKEIRYHQLIWLEIATPIPIKNTATIITLDTCTLTAVIVIFFCLVISTDR